MTQQPTHAKKTLSPEQLDRVTKIAQWMQTLNGQQVSDLMKQTPDKPQPKHH